MDELKALKKSVRRAYNLLPLNTKKQCCDYQNCSPQYFSKIVAGDPKDKKTYLRALRSIQKVSRKNRKKALKNHREITEIIQAHIQPKKQSEVIS